jgi:glycosyltransferase involved in cell wall biosynthesis
VRGDSLDCPPICGEAYDIVHISTSARGGAGIAARRVAQAQARDVGQRIAFISRDRSFSPDSDLDSNISVFNSHPGPGRKTLSRLVTGLNQRISSADSILFTPVSISTITPSYPILRGCRYLHVHNAYNLVSPKKVQDLTHGKVFIHLHDERFLTNGCHYTMGCLGFVSDCKSCPQSRVPDIGLLPRHRANHKHLSRAAHRVVFIAPSEWMFSRAKLAGVAESRLYHVPNPIDTQTFSPSVRGEARRSLGLSPDALIIAWQPGKNDEALVAAMRLLEEHLPTERAQSIYILVPSAPRVALPFETISTGFLATEEDRSRFWGAADIGVSATRMDNFPNVVLESLAVGTPFVIPRIGGAGEAVDATGGGIAVDEPHPEALARGLEALILSPIMRDAMRTQGRTGIEREFGYEQAAHRMDQVYAAVEKLL